MDIRKIALQLAGKFPPYNKPFARLDFMEYLNEIFGFGFDKIDFYWKQSKEYEEEFYYLVLDFLDQRAHKDPGYEAKLNKLISQLGIEILSKEKDREASDVDNKEILRDSLRPLLITEGKTDVQIITTAWSKLYPDIEMPFEIIESGVAGENGDADKLKNQLQHMGVIAKYRTIIGLFDNDSKGNASFKGLRKELFEDHAVDKTIRKSVSEEIYALLLPVPDSRKEFVSDTDIDKRYLQIEHYFSDDILKKYKLKGKEVASGSLVFEISGSKSSFSSNCDKLDLIEFENFKILFDEILKYI